MKTETADLTKVVDALEGLRQELHQLQERVAVLEAAAAAPPPAALPVRDGAVDARPQPQAAAPPGPAPPRAEGLSEEIVLVIGAAIAAFLGKKAHIRAIQLVASPAWAQQGRITIQASHALSVHSARSQP
jgi:methylmalonyl-CoA carboxyltransferase large subunit